MADPLNDKSTASDDNLHSVSSRDREAERWFYGRKAGKTLTPNQCRLMEEFLPTISVDIEATPPADGENLLDIFDDLSGLKEIWVESGFGGGEHLIHRAQENPSIGFIGIEPFRNGMVKAVGEVEERALENIRFHYEEAGPLLDWLPHSSLDGMYLLYPDPWPKKRHWKRRFFSPANLDRIVRVLKQGAQLRFASDIDTYVEWALSHIQERDDFEWIVETPSDWRNPWTGWPSTRYEAKAIREGRTPAYLTFRKI